MTNTRNLFYTLKHLRFKQVYYRLFYIIRNKFFYKKINKELQITPTTLIWEDVLYTKNCLSSKGGFRRFRFLNIEHVYQDNVDWNLCVHGKLWTYNLNYFDFLNQKDIDLNDSLELIKNFIKNDDILKDGKEPYPISLRGINWIKFLSKNNISNHNISQALYNHYQLLINNLEYHLLGNHLLENGYALLFGAYYFKDEILYKKAKQILLEELKEQVLNDGAHFELTPMYHQIILHRLLDCINLIDNNHWKEKELFSFLKNKSIEMLSWLESITFNNGNIPMVNDSAYGIAPSSQELFKYAQKLGLEWGKIKLSESGYRKFENNIYELLIDVGEVGPKYQPGHAHSDTFSFELYIMGKPIIVDTGVSTYEKNEKRQLERSTLSHNTVQIAELEQSEVWGGFRVGRRAKVISFTESKENIKATHNGFKKLNITHSREFKTYKNEIIIFDSLSKKTNLSNRAFFHLHPSIKYINIDDNLVNINKTINLYFVGASDIRIENYNYAIGFNKTKKSKRIVIYFNQELQTKIST